MNELELKEAREEAKKLIKQAEEVMKRKPNKVGEEIWAEYNSLLAEKTILEITGNEAELEMVKDKIVSVEKALRLIYKYLPSNPMTPEKWHIAIRIMKEEAIGNESL